MLRETTMSGILVDSVLTLREVLVPDRDLGIAENTFFLF